MADPVTQFVGSLVARVVVGAINFIATFVGFEAAVFVADVGIKLAAVAFISNVYEKLVGQPDFSVEAQGNQLTVRGTLEHQRLIYGETLVSGPVAYFNTAGTNNQSLFYAIMLAGHECDDITDVWLDANTIPNSAIDWAGDGSVDSGDFRGNVSEPVVVYLEKNLGAAGQTRSDLLNAAFADISSAHRGQGICYLVARLDYLENQTQVWSAGVPQNYRALVRGKRVYDPRSDDTQSFGTGPHRVDSDGTWEWSDNGALIWADHMTDTRLGFGAEGCSFSNIDYGYVASAAEVCDGVVFTPVGTDRRFRTNGVLSTAATYEENAGKILSSFNGTQTWHSGQFRIRAWTWDAPTVTIDETTLVRDAEIRLQPIDSDVFNTVRGYFIDPDRLYTANQFPQFTSSEYQVRDGRQFYRDIQLPMTTDVYMAQRLAAGVLEQSDNGVSVVWPSNFKTARAEVGDTVSVNLDKTGWEEKTFRVFRHRVGDLRSGDRAGVGLVLREDSAAAYSDVATTEYAVSSGGSYVPPAAVVPPPSSLWVAEGVNEILVNFTPPPARLYETVEVYSGLTNVLSDSQQVFSGRGRSFEMKVDAPATRHFWARAQNVFGEYSVFLPNSDATDVIAGPNPVDTSRDYTFDKNTDIHRFWDPIITSAWNVVIQQSEGIDGTNAMMVVQSYENDNIHYARPKNLHQIEGFTAQLRARYRVASLVAGPVSQNSIFVYAQSLGRTNQPTPQREPPVFPVNTGTDVVLDEARSSMTALNTTGSWDVLTFSLSTSEAWVDGYKLGRFLIGTQHASSPNSLYVRVFFDNISYRYTA